MAPSPSKSKHGTKSSGKWLWKKDGDRQPVTSSHSNGASGSGKKEDTSGSGASTLDMKDCPLMLPVLSPIDHIRHLPRFSNLCNGDTLSMEELDNLQLELELLASSVLVMKNSMSSEIALIQQLEKGKIVPRPIISPGKRFKQDSEKCFKKSKDNNGKARDVVHTLTPPSVNAPLTPPSIGGNKVKCSIVKNEPLFDVPDLPSLENQKPPPPRNDITNRFWLMVDTYCQEINAVDIKLLEEMISARNEDPDVYKVQPLGKHYTLRWAQEDLMDEQKDGNKIGDNSPTNGSSTKRKDTADKSLRELDMNHHSNGGNSTTDDTSALGPIAQRLLAGLVEEKNTLLNDNAENKALGVTRPGMLRSLGLGSGVGLEKRLKKELQEQGIMEPDFPGQEDDDEIQEELKKCQADLRSVSSHNHQQLSRLLKLAREALVRHDLKKKLKDAEAKVIEAYKNLASIRLKKKTAAKKDKDLAWRAIKEREAIVRQLDNLGVTN